AGSLTVGQRVEQSAAMRNDDGPGVQKSGERRGRRMRGDNLQTSSIGNRDPAGVVDIADVGEVAGAVQHENTAGSVGERAVSAESIVTLAAILQPGGDRA